MRSLKIGTRESKLALWQAGYIKQLLVRHGVKVDLELIQSEGDTDLVSPLYEMGVQGIFTKSIDAALIAGKIDIGVHSFKDVPTQLPSGLMVAAVPERGSVQDVLVYKDESLLNGSKRLTIASSSLRRIAQWLHRYPDSKIKSLRGNINTRLKKLKENQDWDAAIFALAGIQRVSLEVPLMERLEWMLPAPAQGAIVTVCREDDQYVLDICNKIEHLPSRTCTDMERSFLRAIIGGCSTPAGALAQPVENKIHFHTNLLSLDGKQKVEAKKVFSITEIEDAGSMMAEELLDNGGEEIIKQLELQQLTRS